MATTRKSPNLSPTNRVRPPIIAEGRVGLYTMAWSLSGAGLGAGASVAAAALVAALAGAAETGADAEVGAGAGLTLAATAGGAGATGVAGVGGGGGFGAPQGAARLRRGGGFGRHRARGRFGWRDWPCVRPSLRLRFRSRRLGRAALVDNLPNNNDTYEQGEHHSQR